MNGILSETMHFVDPFWDYRLKSDRECMESRER